MKSWRSENQVTANCTDTVEHITTQNFKTLNIKLFARWNTEIGMKADMLWEGSWEGIIKEKAATLS